MSGWIEFKLAKEQNSKTQIWDIIAKEDNSVIGQIKWFGAWRKYSFFPNENTIYEQTCLDDIRTFLIDLMLQRKKKLIGSEKK